MSLKFGRSSPNAETLVQTKKPTNHYKWISMLLGFCLAAAACGAVYEFSLKKDLHSKIERHLKTISENAKERDGLQQQIQALTTANQQVINDLRQENEGKIAAFAKQAAACDEIKKRYGFK